MLQTLQTLLHLAFLSNLREQFVQKCHCITTVYLYNFLVCCFFLLYFVRIPFVSLSNAFGTSVRFFFFELQCKNTGPTKGRMREAWRRTATQTNRWWRGRQKKKALHTGDANVEPWAIGSMSWQAIMSGGKSFIRLTFSPHRQLSYKAEFSAVKTRCKIPPSPNPLNPQHTH